MKALDIKTEPFQTTTFQLVTFLLGNEEYAVDIAKVQEINKMTKITPVPNVAHYVEGVINLRGKVIPVVSLRKMFGLPELVELERSKIMILDVNSHTVGLIVDDVSEVLRISSQLVEPPSVLLNSQDGYILGIAKVEGKLITLLDIDKLLESVV